MVKPDGFNWTDILSDKPVLLFCRLLQDGNCPLQTRKVSPKKISLGWKPQRRWRCAEQRQQGSSAPALWHSSSSHLLYEMNSQRRPGKKLSRPSVLWTILPVNWSYSAGRMSFKAKLFKYGVYPISLAAGTGGFLLTSAELVKDLYS